MSDQDRKTWRKRNHLKSNGVDPKPWRGLQIHSQNTEKHEFVKFSLAFLLDSLDRSWDTEVQFDTGRVDVLDLGPDDGRPVVYEVETDVTQSRHQEKIEQYCIVPVRDVIVVDPTDVPDEFNAAIEYLHEHVVIGSPTS
jgi:hypothetical protein